jgi:hypothetical protein
MRKSSLKNKTTIKNIRDYKLQSVSPYGKRGAIEYSKKSSTHKLSNNIENGACEILILLAFNFLKFFFPFSKFYFLHPLSYICIFNVT